MKLLQGKNVIITGASRGIGKGIAEVFAKHGANIAFTYASSEGPALELEKELTALGVKQKHTKATQPILRSHKNSLMR
jgi:3-oxoacyl-[acyl-carrier protein] reductase